MINGECGHVAKLQYAHILVWTQREFLIKNAGGIMMGRIIMVKAEKKKTVNRLFTLERDTVRNETEVYHINGFILGRHGLPWHKGQSTRAYFLDNETMEVTEIGRFTTPFDAAKEMIKVFESKAGERAERKERKHQEWLNHPLTKIMLNDYDNLLDDRFKPRDFGGFYSRKIWEYEANHPELAS